MQKPLQEQLKEDNSIKFYRSSFKSILGTFGATALGISYLLLEHPPVFLTYLIVSVCAAFIFLGLFLLFSPQKILEINSDGVYIFHYFFNTPRYTWYIPWTQIKKVEIKPYSMLGLPSVPIAIFVIKNVETLIARQKADPDKHSIEKGLDDENCLLFPSYKILPISGQDFTSLINDYLVYLKGHPKRK